MSAGGGASPYGPLLDRLLHLPQPQLQRHAVSSLFQSLSASANSPHARDAISLCLRSPPSPAAAVDQAARELCRLFDRGLVTLSLALVELQSALEGCDPKLVGVLVKAIGFVCRSAFRTDPCWGRQFDPVELHPFVKMLSCRVEVQDELIQQVLLFIAHNRSGEMEAVAKFMRPFFIFSIIIKPFSTPSSTFAKDLISAVASLSCSFPSEAISIFKLLAESLKFFPCANKLDFKHLISSAEYVVDAFVVSLKLVISSKQLTSTIQACGVEVVGSLFSLCTYFPGAHINVEAIVELSKCLLLAQKELGLLYLPEFSMVIGSISISLTHVELEHETLSILKLLNFLLDWRTENGAVCCLPEELLCVFPVISLLSCPSKSVKTVSTYLLKFVEKTLLYPSNVSLMAPEKRGQLINSQMSVPFRLLHHLWFQEHSHIPYSTYLGLASSIASEIGIIGCEPNQWACQLRAYLLGVLQVMPHSQPAEGTIFLLNSIVCVLLMHPMLGSSAADSLAAFGLADPKLGMPLLQALLFYNKLLCSVGNNSPEMLLRLFEMLPSLASHSVMVPLVVQTILPMLQKSGNIELYAVAIRLLCKTWMVNDRTFGTFQEFVDPKSLSDFISERQICISIASSIRDVCRHNPDRGVDLILSVASCIESQDSTVQALGLESLAHLCEADVVDFYTAWDVISKHSLDYSIDPIVAHGLCILSRWGAMDAAAYPDRSKMVLQILWDVATSRNSFSAPLWAKARISAFKSLSHYEVEHLLDAFPEFRETNFQCLVTEDNASVLIAMEEFESKIINFEHINRRRVHKQKRTTTHKVEKLLDVFPQVIFSQGSHNLTAGEMPEAALLSLVFTPKDTHGKSKDLGKLHATYEKALLEISEALHVSRNILIALLTLQSWKTFVQRWIREVVTHADAKEPYDTHAKISKAANDIFKILCKVAMEALPRVAVNIGLAIGALCVVVPSSVHSVVSAAVNFLLKWLADDEHEHHQWSAALSLGLICNSLQATDRRGKLKIITDLLETVTNSRSYLVKGACGMGLGFASQELLSRFEVNDSNPSGSSTELAETLLLHEIIKTLSMTLSQICPSASNILRNLNACFPIDGGDTSNEFPVELPIEYSISLEDDGWGIAGLVLGLGNSVPAIYRSGAYDAVLKIKEILISWLPVVDSSDGGSIFSREMSEVPLSMGSCLALPAVMSFCQRTELMDSDSDLLYRYSSLISVLLSSKKSGALCQNLLMASCVGAGSFFSTLLLDGTHSLKLDDVKQLLEILRDTYTQSYPPSVHLGGMLGVVNAFGAGAGDLTCLYSRRVYSQADTEQGSTFITNSILFSPACDSLSTSIVQELFLVAKESRDLQIKRYSAWAISFLREKWWSKDLPGTNSGGGFSMSSLPHQNFAEDNLVSKLSLWLRDIDLDKPGVSATTISTLLRCLSKAPRLPTLDWGAIIRRCMRYGAKHSGSAELSPESLREECVCFCLARAEDVGPLLLFLDELSDLSRFRTLELNLQSKLLSHLSDLLKIFSRSRSEKLSEDLVAYFCSSASSSLNYKPHRRTPLRISFWKGLHECLVDALKETTYLSVVERCMECLFRTLTVLSFDTRLEAQVTGNTEEWAVAMKCLSNAPQGWLMDMLQVLDTDIYHGGSHIDEIAKRISTRARLVRVGCIPVSDLDTVKVYILNTRYEGPWWNVLVDVVAAVSAAASKTRIQWLLDALEISCVAPHPSTALRFVSLLSGWCCRYMPLLTVDPETVLTDLPITLPSLLSDPSWRLGAPSVAEKLWASTERICSWAVNLARDDGDRPMQGGIADDEAPKAGLLAHSLYRTCVALKDYLPLQQQVRLANLDISQL